MSHSTDTPAFSNTPGDTWHLAGSVQAQGNNNLWIGYAYNTSGNASDVVTATWTPNTSNYTHLSCYAVHDTGGSFTTDPLDANLGSSGNSASINSGSLTVTGSSDFILAEVEADGRSYVAGTGYTLVDDTGAGGGGFAASEYHIVTASEAATASCGANAWVIKAAAFKASGGGSTGSTLVGPSAVIGPGKVQ